MKYPMLVCQQCRAVYDDQSPEWRRRGADLEYEHECGGVAVLNRSEARNEDIAEEAARFATAARRFEQERYDQRRRQALRRLGK